MTKPKSALSTIILAIFVDLQDYMDENLITISQFCEITHLWERSTVTLATSSSVCLPQLPPFVHTDDRFSSHDQIGCG